MERVLARVVQSEAIRNVPDDFDDVKALEGEVLRRIESSSLQAAAGKRELALTTANEATKAMSALKVASQRSQQVTRANDMEGRALGQPLTTGINLFDLSLAVKCNLAERLKNNGQLEEALEIYTQICKMAASEQVPSGGHVNSAGSNHVLSAHLHYNTYQQQQQQQQQQSRSLLYRFGLDIGNVLCEMKEFQRALKYYRLTLDRLSTLAGQRNLQIKLMNNIAIALMALNGAIPIGQQRRGADSSGGRAAAGSLAGRSNDHMTSLNLLLADNTLESPGGGMRTPSAGTKPQQQQQQQADDQAEASSARQVINGNHHRFALNLMVCHHSNSDLAAIYSTLRALLGTNNLGGPQFRRVPLVLKFVAAHEQSRGSSSFRGDELAGERGDERKGAPDVLAHAAPSERRTSSCESAHSEGRRQSELELELVSGRTLEKQIVRSTTRDRVNELAPHHTGEQPARAAADATPKSSTQTMTQTDTPNDGILVDELESLIQTRERQIHRALLVGCKLAIDLETRLSSSSSSSSSSRSNANDNLGRATGRQLQTSALAKCCKLAASGELYRRLRDELLSDSVGEQCLAGGHSALARALFVLEQIALDQQVADGVQRVKAERSSERLKSERYRSPLVEANSLLWRALTSPAASASTTPAIHTKPHGHLLDDSNADFLANVASYQMRLANFEQASELLARLKSTRWPLTFNRLLASAANQSHPDDVSDLVAASDESLRRDGVVGGGSSSFSRLKMALLSLKLAALYRGAGLLHRSQTVLANLLPPDATIRPNLSPELCLLALSAPTSLTRDEPNSTSHSLVAQLQQASRWHPYHLALGQRLIALLISGFHYTEAAHHLAACIKSRPDQVKWYQMLAECHQRDSNYNEAIRIYRYAMESFPASESCSRALAKLEDELGLGLATSVEFHEANFNRFGRRGA